MSDNLMLVLILLTPIVVPIAFVKIRDRLFRKAADPVKEAFQNQTSKTALDRAIIESQSQTNHHGNFGG